MPDSGKRNKNLILGAVFVLAIFMALLFVQGASAQTKVSKTGFENICATKDSQGRPIEGALARCVQQIYVLALGLGSLVALLMIILAGYRYMTAAGNAQQVESAKEAFASAFIGLIVIFVAFILLYLINPDLVKFRGLSFTSTTQRSGEAPITVSGAFIQGALVGNRFIQSGLGGASLESDGTIVMLAANGQRLVLTPSNVSSLPGLFEQSLRALGLDPSSVSVIEYDVNDPSLLPDSVVRLMNGDRPSRLLVVVGSFFLFNADALHADTTGQTILEAVKLVALNHFGVDIDVLAQVGAGGSCGATCRLCDNNPTQCGAAPGCLVYQEPTTNNQLCIATSSTGGTLPPSGSCPTGTVWSGHMDASGQPICNSTSSSATCQQPPSGSCPTGTCWTGHLDTSQSPSVPICQTQSVGTTSPTHTAIPATAITSTPSNAGSFTPCTLRVYCEDDAGDFEREADASGCQDSNMRVECYYSWQSEASIDCDRTYRLERESCLRQVGPGQTGGTASASGLSSCDSAQPGSACTSSDGAVHCAYSDQEEAFLCGQAWAGITGGYCLPEGSLEGCVEAPDCTEVNLNPGAHTPGERAACE